MTRSWKRWFVLLAPLALISLGLACSGQKPTATPVPVVENVQKSSAQTASYRIELRIGPVVSMPASMMSAAMTTTDQGQPVNHHLEVHMYDRNNARIVGEAIPDVSITERSSGARRELTNITACLTLRHREIEPHFGDNLYLSGGRHTITVGVGDERASFEVSL